MPPYEAFYGKKPTIANLQPLGRTCYMHIPEDRQPPRSKLLPRAEQGLFLRYTESFKIYKVHIPARRHTFMISALDVKFHKTEPIQESPSPESPSPVMLSSSEMTPHHQYQLRSLDPQPTPVASDTITACVASLHQLLKTVANTLAYVNTIRCAVLDCRFTPVRQPMFNILFPHSRATPPQNLRF